ncbi:MAG TPA: hypothetical protein DEO82_01280 [Eubacterium sp.]|jgi:hypothetical protein|nr:hypothetical protein [Lachnospiraceae bacterium]HBZ52382.1 hypothetical protein [Eubacterium sp.]
MNVNGVTSATGAYTGYGTKAVKKSEEKKSESTSDKGVIYEKTKASDVDREALIEKLKADSQARISQMQSLVTDMFKKQGKVIGTADDMWKVLASGDFTADEETVAKAKEDISEDGYWGVKQTSERIFEFAKALSGGDPEKMKKMQEAVEKGFGEATKTWGKDMPEITTQTHDAINQKFKDFFGEE